MNAASYFEAAAGFSPLPFQLAWMELGVPAPVRTLEAPTGLGKTLATLVGWLWDRQQRPEVTPRRLVYQLPLRTLTDQIAAECRAVIERLGMAIPVHVLRGGQIENDYADALAAEAVIVGTLDQVVSRQLMRGYCCSRWSWPRHFAALNSDVRIVVDETQLQGAAVRTAMRLQELHDKLGGPMPRELVLCSATLDAALLKEGTPQHGLSDADYEHPVAQRKVGRTKPLSIAGDAQPVDLVRTHHQQGTLTLVVVNQVRRAQEIASQLGDLPLMLLHSRFRRAERQEIEARLRQFRGLLIATQTVEAGIDLDARLLITDLCPWASFVQRCGRVGRNNTYPDAAVIVMEPAASLPYEDEELAETRQRLEELDGDACVRNLMRVAAPPQPDKGKRLRGDTFVQDLFDTHPAAQGDVDISPYLRVGEMKDVSLLWRKNPHAGMAPSVDAELCSVSLKSLKDRYTKFWTPAGEGWIEIPFKQLRVGAVAAVASTDGGYDPERGWWPEALTEVMPVAVEASDLDPEEQRSFSYSTAVTLPQHLSDAREEATELCSALSISTDRAADLIRAAWLHDIGKAHPVFQATMRANGCSEGLWAKAPGRGSKHERRGFRHEVASALAALQMGENDLIAYLVMSHHGKVRLRLEPFPWHREEDPLHGVIDGEVLPAVPGVCDATALAYPPMDLGADWSARARRLLRFHGPFRLAWLEALLREADARASRRWQTPTP